MTIFNRLLLAIDLSPDSDLLLSRVWKICSEQMERVHVVHVLRNDAFFPGDSLDAPDADLRRLHDQAVIRLNTALISNGFSIPSQQVYIKSGEPATEIKRLAHDLEADLVIVGSHNKNGGWMSLPGATTNCVLQGIESDVMAVRV
ncbi:MAG: universal stress protein [Gammaproteobacteria bacterium]|nr:universal stress protein [Gammaproteobacteria bacterium]